MNARQLFQAGRLDEAIEALGAEVRDNPTDAQRRAFLFELLCFAGQYRPRRKAARTFSASGGREAEMGALLYHAALHAERLRQDMFEKQSFPASPAQGRRRHDQRTAVHDDHRRRSAHRRAPGGVRRRAVHLASVRAHRLRSRRGAEAAARPAVDAGDRSAGGDVQGLELGEVLLPAIAPLTWRHADPAVRLGRVTEWTDARRTATRRRSDRRCCSSTMRSFRSWSCASSRSRTFRRRRRRRPCRCAMIC